MQRTTNKRMVRTKRLPRTIEEGWEEVRTLARAMKKAQNRKDKDEYKRLDKKLARIQKNQLTLLNDETY